MSKYYRSLEAFKRALAIDKPQVVEMSVAISDIVHEAKAFTFCEYDLWWHAGIMRYLLAVHHLKYDPVGIEDLDWFHKTVMIPFTETGSIDMNKAAVAMKALADRNLSMHELDAHIMLDKLSFGGV